jgi:hypothetical protein
MLRQALEDAMYRVVDREKSEELMFCSGAGFVISETTRLGSNDKTLVMFRVVRKSPDS